MPIHIIKQAFLLHLSLFSNVEKRQNDKLTF